MNRICLRSILNTFIRPRSQAQLYRLLTYRVRTIPDFIIIGAQRSGTTSMFRCLMDHPCISPPSKKEIHFFDINYMKGTRWYQAQFPSKYLYTYHKLVHNHRLVTGEASPYYIFHPLAAGRVQQFLPDVKIIAILRNPVDRAYSHYHHEVRLGIEKLPFEEAIACEEQRLEGEMERLNSDSGYYSHNHQHYTYLSRGIYHHQILKWVNNFPGKNIMIICSEAFYSDPQTVLNQVCVFLDLPEYKWKPPRIYQKGDYSIMNPHTRKFLTEYFEPYNHELYEYMGIDFGW